MCSERLYRGVSINGCNFVKSSGVRKKLSVFLMRAGYDIELPLGALVSWVCDSQNRGDYLSRLLLGLEN